MAALAARKFFIYHAGPPTGLFLEASSDFSKPLQTSSKSLQIFPRILPVIQPPAPHHLMEAPPSTAPARRGEPRLRKSSARQLYHLPVTRTVLLEFTFLGSTRRLDQPTEIKISERGATGTPLYHILRGAGTWQAAYKDQ
ncbi:hypothetical protein MTP99_004509 [Tenebrio molitor]|nr:hypothetical protein MTP99_004509 [Tenebrio molitor]